MSTCQRCKQPVIWSAQPKDVKYSAFVHVDTNTTKCSTDEGTNR